MNHLVQEIRNAFDNRDRGALENVLDRLAKILTNSGTAPPQSPPSGTPPDLPKSTTPA